MAANSSRKAQAPRSAPQPPGTGGPRTGVIMTAVLGVATIAACAILLSYNGIYQIAVRGGIDERLAHLYPALFTLLLVMAFWTTYLLRDAQRRRRLWVDALVLTLILLAAAASAMNSLRYELLDWAAAVVVAVAPWIALLIAFRLLLWITLQLRGERSRPRRGRAGTRTGDTPAGHGSDDADRSGSERTAATSRPASAAPVPRFADEHADRDPGPASGPAPRPAPDPVPAPVPAADPAVEEPIRPFGSPAAETVPESFVDSVPLRAEELSAPDNWTVEPRPVAPEPPPVPAEVADVTDVTDVTDVADVPGNDEELPRRPRTGEESAIRKAAASPEPVPLPSLRTPDPSDSDSDSDSDPMAPDDGFDADEPLDDPTSDEAHEPVGESPEPAVWFPPDPEPEPRRQPLPQLRKRPMVLRPRKTGSLPQEPPSGRVRSAPTPPRD
ncbi:DUF2637 domain-containing protein [Actinorugispora endophytica]|uniref:Uncharacterized protein DUF2637 n=1 Tax=Actinorugispora endophytica TaxID=1605990 RepID=A0A4V3D990_9ACTN|nr:DUF2637 domain-containing protein [Actinorugispora endophytica]TDQ55170.1 uncharacterized protein DUF2637 [Actinorugispora endophytica]